MKKNIRKQIKADYEDLQIKPSSDLWSRLENELDKSIPSSQPKSKVYWWKYTAIFLVLISLVGISYVSFDKNDDHHNTSKIVKRNPKPARFLKENIEILSKNNSNEFVENSTNKHQVNNEEIALEKQTITQQENNVFPKQIIGDEININSHIENTQKNNSESIAANQEITDLPKVETSENLEKPNSTKYVTAHDLIFQRKYHVEEKQNPKQNTGRLGIIKIKKIDVNPEFISIFKTTNSSE